MHQPSSIGARADRQHGASRPREILAFIFRQIALLFIPPAATNATKLAGFASMTLWLLPAQSSLMSISRLVFAYQRHMFLVLIVSEGAFARLPQTGEFEEILTEPDLMIGPCRDGGEPGLYLFRKCRPFYWRAQCRRFSLTG
jgi:hypothetical protein